MPRHSAEGLREYGSSPSLSRVGFGLSLRQASGADGAALPRSLPLLGSYFSHNVDYVRLFLSVFLCLLENCIECFVSYFS